MELVGLSELGDRLAKKYSLGMKQRLGLAGALLLSVICVKSEESRSAVNIVSTIVSVLLVLMILGIVALVLVMNFLQ